MNGSRAESASVKTLEPAAATIVSTTENIIARTRAHAPPGDDLLHGRVRQCRSCGCETTNDRYCDACVEARSAERSSALDYLCRRHGGHQAEDLPAGVLAEHQAEWGGNLNV